MAAKISPEQNRSSRRPTDQPLATQLEQLAFERDKGHITIEQHAVAKAQLLASNTP